jgi:hypothetical protein
MISGKSEACEGAAVGYAAAVSEAEVDAVGLINYELLASDLNSDAEEDSVAEVVFCEFTRQT